jgi:arginine-tRNA-protein transferase
MQIGTRASIASQSAAINPQKFSHYPTWPAPLKVRLAVCESHPCSYLPKRSAQMRAIHVQQMPPLTYHAFMDTGFRRSGKLVYQPACPGCRACEPMRIAVDCFSPDKSQRRCWRRNADLHVTIGPAVPTADKFELYRRYLRDWHQRSEETTPEDFVSFLYDSPVDTIEFCYRDSAGSLLAVGICDRCAVSLSSVYFYFDPAQSRRSLGTYGVLRELNYAQSEGIGLYYLGYFIAGCDTMKYKSSFGPGELLGTDGVWRTPEMHPT